MNHTTTKQSLLALLMLSSAACATEPSTLASEESNLTMSTSRTRQLAEPIAVPSATDVGRSIADVRAELVGGIEPSESKQWLNAAGQPCMRDVYQVPGYDVVTYQECADHKRILRGYTGGTPSIIWSDHDFDGLIDSWDDDDVDGTGYRHNMDDQNGDGLVDRQAIDVELLGPDYRIEPFEGCELPRAVAMRILEDTDFDGHFDTESITAGRDADGKSTYWICD